MAGPASMFAALGDPVRLAIVERLADGDATVGDLAKDFPITPQAVSKHLKVLEAAGVVSRSRVAQTRPVHLEPVALERCSSWLRIYRGRLTSDHDRLDELLDQMRERP